MRPVYRIFNSDKKNKKLVVVTPTGKKIYFGAKGYDDFTTHKDPERRERYLLRHQARENSDDPQTAAFWATHILWNKKTIAASIRDTASRFKLNIKYVH